jgi:hypothetical protein
MQAKHPCAAYIQIGGNLPPANRPRGVGTNATSYDAWKRVDEAETYVERCQMYHILYPVLASPLYNTRRATLNPDTVIATKN